MQIYHNARSTKH